MVMALVVTALMATASFAQRRFFSEGGFPPVFPPPTGPPSGGFVFCRLMYNSVRYEAMGIGWRTDYPYAEINLMTRASELTKTRVLFETGGEGGEAGTPTHYVVRLTDEALFGCPFTMASDVGTIGLSTEEAAGLGQYLRKGGFLWVDDFWGNEAWAQWAREIGKALPPAEFPIEDVLPGDPIFRTLFEVPGVPQITNIQYWRQVGGRTTSERGAETAEAHLRAIRDSHGRIMVLMSHNTDVADSWEREGEDPEFFYQFSPAGYSIAMNVLMYVMSH